MVLVWLVKMGSSPNHQLTASSSLSSNSWVMGCPKELIGQEHLSTDLA